MISYRSRKAENQRLHNEGKPELKWMDAKAVNLESKATITVTWRSGENWDGNGDRFLGNDSRFVFYRILYFGFYKNDQLNKMLCFPKPHLIQFNFFYSGYWSLVFLSCIIFFHNILPGYSQIPVKHIFDSQHTYLADSVVPMIFSNKEVPDQIRPPFVWAIMSYPELYSAKITIKFKKIRSAGAARPTFGSLFITRSNRKYKIFVNVDTKLLGNAIYDKLSYNAKIGFLAHELAHILEYSKKSSLSLIGNGFLYILSKSYRAAYEENTDEVVIDRGYGWQIHSFTDHVLNKSNATDKYKQFKIRYYISPEEMLRRIQLHPLYQKK